MLKLYYECQLKLIIVDSYVCCEGTNDARPLSRMRFRLIPMKADYMKVGSLNTEAQVRSCSIVL